MRLLRQSVVLNSGILYSLFTQERSLALVYVAVTSGVPPECQGLKQIASGLQSIVACGSATLIEVICALRQWSGGVDADGAFCSRLMLMDIEIPSMEGMKGVLIDASQLLPLDLYGCQQTNNRGIRADSQACGQSFIYEPRFPEEFRGALSFRWGMLRGGVETHQFLTRSSQQLYTSCLLSRRLTYRQCEGAGNFIPR